MLILQQVEDLVIVLDESLRTSASSIGQKLRRAGRRVDLVLEAKKMKWVFKVCATAACSLSSQSVQSVVSNLSVVSCLIPLSLFTMRNACSTQTISSSFTSDHSSAPRTASHHVEVRA